MRRLGFDGGPNEENPRGGKRDHIVQETLVDVYDLENVAGLGAEEEGVFDDEELLLLRGPQHPPSVREGGPRGDGILAMNGESLDGGDDLRSLRGVSLRPEASVLVGDEGEEVGLGPERLAGAQGSSGLSGGEAAAGRASGV